MQARQPWWTGNGLGLRSFLGVDRSIEDAADDIAARQADGGNDDDFANAARAATLALRDEINRHRRPGANPA